MALQNLAVFHFDDTSDSSPAKQIANIGDNRFFRHDAANLPAYLYFLQERHSLEFRHIEEHIRLVAPFFEKFVLAPSKLNEKKIELEWRQKGSDAYFDAWSLSDGALRFICLATLLLQPNPPALILLDEPELGLHPLAIRILSEMLEAASKRVQIILATQSVTLLDGFAPQDVIVAENDGLKTTFKRLDMEKLKIWLDDFSLGEVWEKNVLGGRP
jgi:predicted ATPase